MPIVDAFGTAKKHNVMQDTWGHLYPEPGSKHAGKILVMSHDGSDSVLDRSFPTLNHSPIEFELTCTVLDLYEWSDGLHEVSCTLWFFKSSDNMYLGSDVGKIIKAKVKTLYSTENWS
jgi:hypothetical protein